MKIQYFLNKEKLLLEICTGISNKMEVKEEENPLYWISVDEDFSSNKFAGESNCKHILNCCKKYIANLTLKD